MARKRTQPQKPKMRRPVLLLGIAGVGALMVGLACYLSPVLGAALFALAAFTVIGLQAFKHHVSEEVRFAFYGMVVAIAIAIGFAWIPQPARFTKVALAPPPVASYVASGRQLLTHSTSQDPTAWTREADTWGKESADCVRKHYNSDYKGPMELSDMAYTYNDPATDSAPDSLWDRLARIHYQINDLVNYSAEPYHD